MIVGFCASGFANVSEIAHNEVESYLRWTPPELFMNEKATKASDVYSMAMVLVEVFARCNLLLELTSAVGSYRSYPANCPLDLA
jgi:hypothetical protein